MWFFSVCACFPWRAKDCTSHFVSVYVLWSPVYSPSRWSVLCFNIPLTTRLFSCNFHPLEVVSRWRDPQLQVGENYSDLYKQKLTVLYYCRLMPRFIFNVKYMLNTSISNIWKQLTSILSNLNNFTYLKLWIVGENSDLIIWRLKGECAVENEKMHIIWTGG